VKLSCGLPAFTVVGLPHGAVRESRDRVAAALRNSGFPLPPRCITVNLAPGDVRKEGTAFDLPIAVGLLAVGGHLDDSLLSECAFLGELGLDGSLRPIHGALPIAAECAAAGIHNLVVPSTNAEEESVIPGVTVLSAETSGDVITHFRGGRSLEEGVLDPRGLLQESVSDGLDVRDVRGQAVAKRVLEIAAAVSHNVLFLGPLGSGKTMLARRLAGILPLLTLDEALESTRVHSVAGMLRSGTPLVSRSPFRAPHHTISYAGLEAVHAKGHMRPLELRRWCRPSRAVSRLLQRAVDRVGLSARSYHRILKVARTIADLDGSEEIRCHHVGEAL